MVHSEVAATLLVSVIGTVWPALKPPRAVPQSCAVPLSSSDADSSAGWEPLAKVWPLTTQDLVTRTCAGGCGAVL